MIRSLLIALSVATLVGCLVMLPDADQPASVSSPVNVEAPVYEPVPEKAAKQNSAVSKPSVADNPVSEEPLTAKTQASAPAPESLPVIAEASPTQPAPADLHQPAVNGLCREIGNKLGSVSVSDCNNQNLQFADGFSVNERVLTKRDFLPKDLSEPVSRILIMGGIHGDEYSSISIMFKWMNLLASNQDSDFHWRFLPLANPDGLLDGEATRQNANGVDLNRNFPSGDWERTALESWRANTGSNPRRFPGHSPASEPETQWILKQIEEFKPVVIVSVHAPHALLDFDGPVEAPNKIGHLHLHQLGVYPGSLGNYGGLDLGIPVITLELPSAGIMPSKPEIENMWVDLNNWLNDKAPGLTKARTSNPGISAD
ncbi:murein peptide amidase A [Gammaproteobacteria bacterium LSUCC0112]|nr:murein peptide amidase A [Gammaproteobacteria bacterium LSUCC0112]